MQAKACRHIIACQVQVYERARAYRPMGAGIGIDVNGLKAIEAIDPALERQLSAHGYATTKSVTYDHNGEVSHRLDGPACNAAGPGAAGRQPARREAADVLWTGLRRQLVCLHVLWLL